MSLNKFMHTRNPFYNNPPDYAQLAETYPEFAKFCQSVGNTNKFKLDYTDPEALRALYCVLMKHYFSNRHLVFFSICLLIFVQKKTLNLILI
jgi:hypothetical protein